MERRLKTRALEHKRAFVHGILGWYPTHGREFSWREPGRTPYEILIAELLLKRTTAAAVARTYTSFLAKYPSLSKLASASIQELSDDLATVGLNQQRARSISRLTSYLIGCEGGDLPNSLDRLLQVPGLGDYSSRAILSFGFRQQAAILDNNVARILARVFASVLPESPKPPLLQELADILMCPKSHTKCNFALLDLGALVCRSGHPACRSCPLIRICDYFSKGLPDDQEKPYSPLREIRRSKGMSLVSLSQATGLSKLTIINFESKKTKPRPDTIHKLAAVLGVLPEALTQRS